MRRRDLNQAKPMFMQLNLNRLRDANGVQSHRQLTLSKANFLVYFGISIEKYLWRDNHAMA